MEQTVQSTAQTETKAERKARKLAYKQQKEMSQETAAFSSTKNYVVCLKWGTKYNHHYVNKLFSMVDRNISLDYDFVCFTDDKTGINKNIRTEPLQNLGVNGWWYKPMFLGADLPIKGNLLFLDLDVVVFQNIDKLFDFEPNKFCIIRDFNRSQRSSWDRMNSSVFRTQTGMYDAVWKQFKKNPGSAMRGHRGDQDWMFRNIRDHKFWPDEWIMSYKWEMRDRRDLVLDEQRKRNFKIDAPPRIHKDTCIAVYHGDPNPENANDSWTKAHWG